MNEPRRRERPNRGARGVAAIQPPMPRLVNPWKPIDLLDEDQLQRILAGAYRILDEGGLEIRGARAREIYRRHGARVDEATHIVRMERALVEQYCAKAPEKFVLAARNRDRDMHIGGNVINFGPVHGAPNVTDLDKGRRYGTLEDFRNFIRIGMGLGVLHWQGGVVVEPVDVPVPLRHLELYRAHIEESDTVWAARGVGGVQALDGIAMCAIEHGLSLDELARRPSTIVVTNVNSPRRVDEEILDNIVAAAEHGQAVCITPFTLMGAMTPVTLAGALAQQTAEALGIIALVQMIRPGCPSVFGGFTSNVDMRTGSPAFGTPEFVKAMLGGAQIARALKLPFRCGAPCGSPAADAQAAYETGFSLLAAIMSHTHMVNHAIGWIEGGLAASYEKIVIDAEMLRGWAEILKPTQFSDDDLAIDAILEVPPGGHFFGVGHTLARYENAFWRPILSDWSNFENWRDAGSKDATQRANAIWKRTLAAYQAPPLDPAIKEAIDAFVAKRKEEIGA